MKCWGFALLLFLITRSTFHQLEKFRNVAESGKGEREALYLPEQAAVRFLSFDNANVASHYFWFKTINYFGKHHATDRDYRWLSHMCDLVVTLNPHADHATQFCSNMLSWEAKTPELSVKLLDKAIAFRPDNWWWHYLRGFTYLFFLGDAGRAKNDFVQSAKLPGAHPMVGRLAAKQLAALESSETAIEFLRDMIRRETNPAARATLEQRLLEVRGNAS